MLSVESESESDGTPPDEELGEELLRFASERLPKFKWLRGVYFVDELPKTANGKIQRFKLRKAS